MFKLSNSSKTRLETVHPLLRDVVNEAIQKTVVDFGVLCGVRTPEEQRELMNNGATHTLKSKHLKQSDGYAHAVDLVAYVNGKVCWELGVYLHVATAMQQAGKMFEAEMEDEGYTMRWGGAWQERDFANSILSPKELQQEYIRMRMSQDQDPFIDAPHFEFIS